jgi:probable HAF family extracellular repeat protein
MSPLRNVVSYLLLALLFICAAGAQTYTVTDLGVLTGFTSSHAYDNNNPGQATGCSDNSVYPSVPCSDPSIPAEPVLWKNGGIVDLGNLSGFDSGAGYVVNDSMEVVGYSGNSQTGNQHGFFWNQGMMTDLGTLTGSTGWSNADAITSKGVIVGSSYISKGGNNQDDLVLWTNTGGGYQIQDEDVLPGYPHVYPYDINEKLLVTGIACQDTNCNKPYRAFLWSTAKGWQKLSTLAGGKFSYGSWINSSGVIAGFSTSTKYPNGVSVYWDAKHKIHSIGTLPGGDSSSPGFITDSGEILGESTVAGGDNHAYIWSKKKKMRDLNNMIPKNSGWDLHHAASVNNKGQIVGYGTINGVDHAFLLTP